MNAEYKNRIKTELKRYDMGWKAHILKYDSYYIGSYIKAMRIVQYCESHNSLKNTIIGGINKLRMRSIGHKIGLQIHTSKIDWGIRIHHWGNIVINQKAIIGNDFCIYPGCCIGKTEHGGVPTIGNNVTFFTNSAAYGGINIGNNVIVAANAVVMHDVPDNCIVAGVPAKVIKTIN